MGFCVTSICGTGVILSQLIKAYCTREGIPWREEGQPFFRELQKEAMANMQELVEQVPEAAQRIWTSPRQLRGREFCFILNAAVRHTCLVNVLAVWAACRAESCADAWV